MAQDRRSPAPRRAQDRLNDHATIDRLTDELLPALVAKLGANGLGELEVREGTWHVRLRMPADGHVAAARRSSSGRQQVARATDGSRGEHVRTDATGPAGAGHAPVSGRAAGSGHVPEVAPVAGPSRVVATSPAVGYFRPRGDLRAGTKVRAGDRIGSVDVLGIGQDLVAPGDGLIGATLVAPGEPVEYGQTIIVLEQLAEPRPRAGGATALAAEDAVGGESAAAAEIPAAPEIAPAAEIPPAEIPPAEIPPAETPPPAEIPPAADPDAGPAPGAA